jgi:formamidopyrimidine-DNA glycosylase
MPELPEVETVVRTLRAAVLGSRIVRVQFASSRISKPNVRGWKGALSGAVIDSIDRHGKYIILAFHTGARLIVHLRMTGRFRLHLPNTKRGAHDRLSLLVEGGMLRERALLVLVDTRQFARADFLAIGSAKSHPGIAKLGPEADQVTETQLRRILARSHRPIKSLLLDQTALAGLGNIYADESLHASGIHPLTPCDLVDRGQVRRLRLAIGRILGQAILACGTTFDSFSDLSGEAGGFAPYLAVYSRTGSPCKTCQTPIQRITLSGRSAHFCPYCQQCVA